MTSTGNIPPTPETETMDPNATIQRLIDAINDQNHDDAADAASDYAGWLSRGGFPAECGAVYRAYKWFADNAEHITLSIAADDFGAIATVNGDDFPLARNRAAAMVQAYHNF